MCSNWPYARVGSSVSAHTCTHSSPAAEKKLKTSKDIRQKRLEFVFAISKHLVRSDNDEAHACVVLYCVLYLINGLAQFTCTL